MMPPKKKTTCIPPSNVVCPEPRVEAPPQTDGALDHNSCNDTDDDILTHRIPQIANPGFTKTLTDEAANAEANVRGFNGMSM
jgi:hypothetical protein